MWRRKPIEGGREWRSEKDGGRKLAERVSKEGPERRKGTIVGVENFKKIVMIMIREKLLKERGDWHRRMLDKQAVEDQKEKMRR